TLRLAAAHPLCGAGLGSYADAVAAYKRGHGDVRTTHAESDALELLAEGGLVGLALGLWLAWMAWRGLADRLQHGHDPFRKGVAIGGAAAAATLLLHGMVDFNLHIPSNALLCVSLAGLAAAPRAELLRLGGPRLSAAAPAGLFVLAGAPARRAPGAWELPAAPRRSEPPLRSARLDAVLRRHPYLADGYRARADALWDVARGGDPGGVRLARAEADLGRALRLRPAWGEAWADRAWIAALRRDTAQAREDMERALRFDHTHPGILSSSEALNAWLARPALPEAAQ